MNAHGYGGGGTRITRRRFLKMSAAALALTIAGSGVGQTYRFEVVRQALRVPALSRPLSVAVLSDLHYGPFIRDGSVRAWVEATNAEKPDAVLLTGDIVDRLASTSIRPLLGLLGTLRAPLGVFAVLGNHDHLRFPSTEVFRRALERVGICVLHNTGRVLRKDVYLAGVDDLRHGRPDLAAALAQRPPGTACILLSHNPDVLPEVPAQVDLTLCGHTHGGQVRLPLFGPIVTSSAFGERFVMGWVSGPARGYVTRGLGVTAVPLRWNCPAELTLVELVP